MVLRFFISNKLLGNPNGADSGPVLGVAESPSASLVSYFVDLVVLRSTASFSVHHLFVFDNWEVPSQGSLQP